MPIFPELLQLIQRLNAQAPNRRPGALDGRFPTNRAPSELPALANAIGLSGPTRGGAGGTAPGAAAGLPTLGATATSASTVGSGAGGSGGTGGPGGTGGTSPAATPRHKRTRLERAEARLQRAEIRQGREEHRLQEPGLGPRATRRVTRQLGRTERRETHLTDLIRRLSAPKGGAVRSA